MESYEELFASKLKEVRESYYKATETAVVDYFMQEYRLHPKALPSVILEQYGWLNYQQGDKVVFTKGNAELFMVELVYIEGNQCYAVNVEEYY